MTDFPAIAPTSGIATDTSRLSSRGNLDKAGRQFEAVFTGMMLKSMRAARLAEPLFDSRALDTFNGMSDEKLVQAMAEHTPLGIGKAMTAFLSKAQGAPAAPAGASPDSSPNSSPNSSVVDDSTG